MNASACSICSNKTHLSSECPDLYSGLEPGFYKPSGKYQEEEEEDTIISVKLIFTLNKNLSCQDVKREW